MRLVLIAVAIYIAWFSFFTIQRYRTLHANYYDLGIMDQTVYNTSRGRILELTNPKGSNTIKRMAIHNDILLAVLAPLYWIHDSPETLLVAQTVILALGALLLYLIALQITRSNLVATSIGIMYLLYPPLQWSNTYDFHIVTFATTLLLALFYALLSRRYILALTCFFLVLLAKEQIALVTAMLGVLLVLKPQVFSNEKKLGVFFLLFSIFWFITSIWLIIPYFRTTDHFAISRYAQFGNSPAEVISGVVAKPLEVFSYVINPASLNYLIALLGPLAFVSLLSPVILLLLPELAINLLSNNTNMHSIIFQYTTVLTPIIFLSSIYSLKYMKERFGVAYQNIVTVQLVLTLLYSYYMSPLPYSKRYDGRTFSEVKRELPAIKEWSRNLKDENITVSASLGVAPLFTHRKVMIPFSSHYEQAEYVVLLKQEVLHDWNDPSESLSAYGALLNDEKFSKIYEEYDLIVYKKQKL